MSDFLERLAARSLGLADVIRPRLLSLFEPPPSDGSSVLCRHIDPVIAEALSPQSPVRQETNIDQSSSIRSKEDLSNQACRPEVVIVQGSDRPQITTAGDETNYPAPDGPELNIETSCIQLSGPSTGTMGDPPEKKRQLKNVVAFGPESKVQVGAIKQPIPKVGKTPSLIDDNVLPQGRQALSSGVTQHFRPSFGNLENSSPQSTGSVSPSKVSSGDLVGELDNAGRHQPNEEGLQLTEEPNAISGEDQSGCIQDIFSPVKLMHGHLGILASKGWKANSIEVHAPFESPPPLKRKHTEANGETSMTIGLKDWTYQGDHPPGEDAHFEPSAVPIAREEMPEQISLLTGAEEGAIKGSVDVEERQIDSDNGSIIGRFPARSTASDVSGVLGPIQCQQDSSSMDKVAQHFRPSIGNLENSSPQSAGLVSPSKVFSGDPAGELNNAGRYQSNEVGQQLTEEPNAIRGEDQSGRIQDIFSPVKLKHGHLDILASKGRKANSIEVHAPFESPTLKRKHTEANGETSTTIGLKDWAYQRDHLPGEDAHFEPSAVPIAREEMPEQISLLTGAEKGAIKGSVDVEERQVDSDNGSIIGRFPARFTASDVSGVLGPIQRQQDSPSMDKVASGINQGLVENTEESSHSERNSFSLQPIDDHLAKCILQNLQVSSDEMWYQGRDLHDKALISSVSTQLSKEMKGSDLPAGKDESGNTLKEDKSESLPLKMLLDSGVHRKHQFETVGESIADRHKVSESSGLIPSSFGSREAILEENHTPEDHAFNGSTSLKNGDIFQGNISDISTPGLPTTPNKSRNQSLSTIGSPVKEAINPVEKQIPQYTLLQPLEISGERAEQISSHGPENATVIDAQQYSLSSEEKMKGTEADQEDQKIDEEKLLALFFEEAVDSPDKPVHLQASDMDIHKKQSPGERSVMVLHTAPLDKLSNSLKEGERNEVREAFVGRKMAAVRVGQIEGREAVLRGKNSLQEPIAGLSGIIEQRREDEIGLGETERVAYNKAPEIPGLPEKKPENFMERSGKEAIGKGAKAGESEVFDERGNPSPAGSDPCPHKPGFQQSITGEAQPVAAIRRTLSERLSSAPGDGPCIGQCLPEKDDEQMAAESIPFDKSHGIGETTKSAEEADKNQLSNALPVHNTAHNQPSIQPKRERPSEPLQPPEDNARVERFSLAPEFLERTDSEFWQSPLHANTDIRSEIYPESFPGPASRDISDVKSSGNQDSSNRSSMPRREPTIQSDGEIQTSSRLGNQSETSGQPFVSMAKLVPEGSASTFPSEKETRNTGKALAQSKKITEKALARDGRLDYRESPSDTIISHKPVALKSESQKNPAGTPFSRSFKAQISKLGHTVVPSLISTTQSPVIQMAPEAPEPVNKVKVTVRHIEVRSGDTETSREPLRAAPKPNPALSLEEYLRLRGEGKL